MDEDRLIENGSPSNSNADEGFGGDTSEPFSVSKLFSDAMPAYLAMGMSYEDYWHGPAELTVATRKAFEIKVKQTNQEAWLLGQYVMCALDCTVGNMFRKNRSQLSSYPKEPFPLTQEEFEEAERRKKKEKFEKMKADMIKWAKNSQNKAKPSEIQE